MGIEGTLFLDDAIQDQQNDSPSGRQQEASEIKSRNCSEPQGRSDETADESAPDP
jgi:hypothetical protein